MNNPPINTQLTTVLTQLEKFGFKFFGYGENNDPLVVAPNGQVIPLKIAYEFVQAQIKKATDQASGGPEVMPSMPQMPDIKPIDTTLEKSPEKESGIEQKAEAQTNVLTTQNAQGQQNPATVLPTADIKIEMPFNEGFKPKSFDPTILKEAQSFVEENIKGSSTSAKTWLAKQFEKFLKEYDLKSSK